MTFHALIGLCALGVLLGGLPGGSGIFHVATVEAQPQQGRKILESLKLPPPEKPGKEVVLAIVSSPPNAAVYWSSDGQTFSRFTAGGGLTPLTHRSRRWAESLWFQVRKEGFKDSKPMKVLLAQDVTLNIALDAAHEAPKDVDPELGGKLFREYCASCHGVKADGEGPVASVLNPPPADLLDAAYVGRLSDEHLYKVTKEGGQSEDRSRLMPGWGDILSEQQIRLLIHFIRSASATAHSTPAVQARTARRAMREGEKLFATYCVACHGESGEGNGPLAPALTTPPRNLADAAYMATLSEERLLQVMANGGQSVGKSALMPPWNGWLNYQQLSYVAAYLRELSKKKEAAAAQVAAAADAKGSAARGAKVYGTYCVTCHGPSGKGDGPASAALGPQAVDLTNTTYFAMRTNAYLRTVIRRGGAAVGKSPLMPPWGYALTDEQADDLIAFIRTTSQTQEPAQAAAAPAAEPVGRAEEGAKLYEQLCVSCHGAKGRGDGPAAVALRPRPTDLTAAHYFNTVTNDYLRQVIARGGGAVGKSPLMPGLGNSLKEGQINDMIAYLRQLSGTAGAAGGGAAAEAGYRGSAPEGERIFQLYCMPCHGARGKGKGEAIRGYSPQPPDFSKPGYLSGLSDAYLRTVIAKGGAAVSKSGLMPPLGQALGERGLSDVVAYLLQLPGK